MDVELCLPDAEADPAGAAVDDLGADNRPIKKLVERSQSDTAMTTWSRRMSVTGVSHLLIVCECT